MNTRTYVALLQGNPKICFKTDRWCYVILFEIHCSRYLLIIISTQKSSKKLLEKSKQRIFLPHSVSTLECKRHMAKASASSCRQCLKLKSPLQQVSPPPCCRWWFQWIRWKFPGGIPPNVSSSNIPLGYSRSENPHFGNSPKRHLSMTTHGLLILTVLRCKSAHRDHFLFAP